MLTVTQFLTSLETRPSAQAYKISARVERFFVEGPNIENDLIPVITADSLMTGMNKNTSNGKQSTGITFCHKFDLYFYQLC